MVDTMLPWRLHLTMRWQWVMQKLLLLLLCCTQFDNPVVPEGQYPCCTQLDPMLAIKVAVQPQPAVQVTTV